MNKEPQIEELEQTNQQLQESLKACHELVAEYRAKLAANGNEILLLSESERDSGPVLP